MENLSSFFANHIGTAYLISLFVGLTIVSTLILGKIWKHVNLWMHDGEGDREKDSFGWHIFRVIGFIPQNYSAGDDCWMHFPRNEKPILQVEGESVLFFYLFGSVLLPPVILFMIYFYPIPLTIATLIILAHVGRAVIRLSTKFKKHVKDLNAHREES